MEFKISTKDMFTTDPKKIFFQVIENLYNIGIPFLAGIFAILYNPYFVSLIILNVFRLEIEVK